MLQVLQLLWFFYVTNRNNVTLTAVTLKHGSDYKDEWIGATKVSTVLTEDGYYISTAQVVAQESITVQYNITMSAGKNVFFAGNASTSVNVDEPINVIGAEVKNITPLSWMTGFYIGDTYAVLSNGTIVQTGCTIFGMSENQTSREIEVYVTVSNVQYRFIVQVSK